MVQNVRCMSHEKVSGFVHVMELKMRRSLGDSCEPAMGFEPNSPNLRTDLALLEIRVQLQLCYFVWINVSLNVLHERVFLNMLHVQAKDLTLSISAVLIQTAASSRWHAMPLSSISAPVDVHCHSLIWCLRSAMPGLQLLSVYIPQPHMGRPIIRVI